MSAAVRILGLVALALAAGCDPTTSVRVVQDGVPVPGAEVFANNTSVGFTGADGTLELHGWPVGTRLVARKQVHEIPGYRQNHGSEHGGLSWIQRVYVTSLEVRDTGANATLGPPLIITDTSVQQTLTLRADNVLIGLHFLVSVIWDASEAELAEIGEKFRLAGDYIFNASDGQIYFEKVDIVDDATFWRDAEYHYHADNMVWPNSWSLRGLFVPNGFGSAVSVQRGTNFETIAHEFGHLGFGLMDEYMPDGAFCTELREDQMAPFDPFFGNGNPKASCVMDDQSGARKYCSDHPDNPHVPGALEASNCWTVLGNGFADTESPARWTLKTPVTRGAIIGRLPVGASAQWRPTVNIDNRTDPTSTSLCLPFTVTARWPDGTPGVSWPVSLDVGGRPAIEQGRTDGMGRITVVGAHPGDRVWVGACCGPWRDVVSTGGGNCALAP